VSTIIISLAGVSLLSILKHFLGQNSTQLVHKTHLDRSIFHDFPSRLTLIAPVGHFFWHIPQKIHSGILFATCPLTSLQSVLGARGNRVVAGRLNKLLIIVFPIENKPIILPFKKFKFAKQIIII